MTETGQNKVHIDYLLGKLPEAQRDALERELEQNPDLLAELQKVEATEDSMLQWLRDSFPAARYQNDPHLQALLKNLENSVADLASGNEEAGPVRTTSPLEPLTHETRAIHGSQDDTSRDGRVGHVAPPPPKRLGRYRIESTIGQGGMGAVYLAHDEKLDRPVAMKIPFMGVQADQQVLERFLQEARSAASLHHRNICPIHDVGEIDGQPYLTMAFISGKTLATWVDEPHSPGEIIAVISKVARALHQAHEQGVIHRDLKPANIMIDDEGEPVVMDFGLARRDSDDDQPQLTQAGQIMGTPAYMPPEQISGRTEEMGPPCDIYALGVILYELLTGKRPFNGNFMQLMSQIALESPPALRTINDQIDPQLETIVLKSLEKQPSDRWDSMLAFAEALEGWQPSNAPSKEPPTTWRRWPLIAAGLLGVIGLVWAAAVLIKIDTEAGTIVLEIDDPSAIGAVVTVDGKTIKIDQQGQLPIQVTADEKEHMLKVTKGGFETFTEKFSVKSGGKESIRVRLIAAAKTQPPEKIGWHGWPADAPAPAIAPFDAKQAKQHQQAWADYLKVPVETTNTIGMKFVLIPPGEFLMGSTPEQIQEALEEAKERWKAGIKISAPQHKVVLTRAIYLAVNEVTQKEYEAVTGTNPSHFARNGAGEEAVANIDTNNLPVEQVGWYDAVDFCTKLSQKEESKPFYFRAGETITPLDGTGYRLPTEAEWEFACRAGTTTKYWIGDQVDQLLRVGWFIDNAGQKTHATGELRANPFGLFDIHGNVREWVEDAWDPSHYSKSSGRPAINPIALASAESKRVARGGSVISNHYQTLSSSRYTNVAEIYYYNTGFRVAMPVVSSRGDRSAGIDKPPAKPEPTEPRALPEDIELVAEPVEHKPNEPLSLLALVRDPAPLEGALSWSLQTRHHRTPVNCVQFSPDGSLMATGGSDGTIRLWDYPSNQLKQIISTKNAIGELVFSPGGRYIASVTPRFSVHDHLEPHAEIRETATGRLVKRFPQKAAHGKKYAIAWHPQGERFATIDNADILIWNLQSGIKAKTLKGHTNHIVDVAWSTDGDWLATASESEVILWDTSNWTEQLQLTAKHRVSHLAFSPQSNLLAISGFDKGELGLWKVPEGELTLPPLQSGQTSAISFTPDGTNVIAADKSTNVIRCWDVSNGEVTAEFASTSSIRNLAVSPDGESLISVGDEVRRGDLKTGENSLVFPPCNTAINSPWWLPRKPELGLSIQGSQLWKIKLTPESSIRKQDVRFQGSHPSSVRLSPDGRHFLTHFSDTIARIYDWESEELIATTKLGYYSAWSPDSRLIASCGTPGRGNILRLADVASGKIIRSFDTKSPIKELAYSRGGKHLAITKDGVDGGKDRVEIWDVETGELVQSVVEPQSFAHVAWSVDDKTIAVRSSRNTCQFDVKTGKQIASLFYGSGAWGWGAHGYIHLHKDGQTASLARDEYMFVYDITATREKSWLQPIHKRQFGHHHSSGTHSFTPSWSPNEAIASVRAESHHVSFYEPLKDLELGTLAPVQTEGQTAALFVDANGYYRVIGKLNDELVFNVLRNDGTVQTLTAAEFETQYGWKNDPANTKLIDSIINTYPKASDSKQAESPPSP